MAKLCLNDWPNKSVTLSLITEDLSFLGSGISGSLTEVILLDESFLLFFSALLSSECLGTSGVCTEQPFSFAEWELELTSGLVVICLPAEHPIILAHKGRGFRQDHPMVKQMNSWFLQNQQSSVANRHLFKDNHLWDTQV